MELIQETRRASKFEPRDFISNMPDNVVTNILDQLPLQDSVGTCILARNWRYKWTMLSQLVFDRNFFMYLLKRKGVNDYGKIVNRLLLHLKGSITKFVLYTEKRTRPVLDAEDINHWMLFLSGKGIKDLTFYNVDQQPLKLPAHLFSCLELKHLEFVNCCFDPPASFHGFPSLLSLELCHLQFESGKFVKFFTQCPILEILNMGYAHPMGKVKPTEIAKLTNLKLLSLFLCNIDDSIIISSSSIFELVSCLPKLQELELDFMGCKIAEGVSEKRLPTTFPCFKTLKLSRIYLGSGMNLSCAFEMIRSFRNVHMLEITAGPCGAVPIPFPEVDYNTMGLLELRTAVFTSFNASEEEVCLIKYILACYPFLKKIDIRLHPDAANPEKLFARKLLKLHRASTVAEINLC